MSGHIPRPAPQDLRRSLRVRRAIQACLSFIYRVNEGLCRVTRRTPGVRWPPTRACERTESVAVNAKKVMVLAGVALVLFLLISQPEQSADAVRQVLSWLREGAEAIITFLRSLFN